ncbi:hypothetical protein EMG21_33650 [Klebsiella pneumoniae]|nr:hypothetical protein EMG21_33650 [Klebsiella pneumoniae]
MLAADGASASAAADLPDVSELRFAAKSVSCEPRMSSDTAGAWETSAPRSKVSGDSAKIGLRDVEGATETSVAVSVLDPDEKRYETTAELSGEDWATVTFPADFANGPDSLGKGTYTVVWSTSEEDGGSFISCDGFTVG